MVWGSPLLLRLSLLLRLLLGVRLLYPYCSIAIAMLISDCDN